MSLIMKTVKRTNAVGQDGVTAQEDLACMDNGVVVEEGTAKEIFHSPKEERTKKFLARFSPEFGQNMYYI